MPMVSIRIPAEDLARIDANAQAAGLDRTKWILATASKAGNSSAEEIQRLRREIRKKARVIREIYRLARNAGRRT